MSRLFRGVCLALPLVAACAGEPAPPASMPVLAIDARPLTDVRYERTPERIERGRYLATSVTGCVLCHSRRDTTAEGSPPLAGHELGGAVLVDEEGYRLVAPNLTPDMETGAGSWTDDMFARAIREGVGHDGRGLGGRMWWWSFRNLSDEDVASIVAYLRSVPPVRNELPGRVLDPGTEAAWAEGATPLDGPVATRDLSDPADRGRYLIEVADCIGCHTAWEAEPNPGVFGGGNPIVRAADTVFSANISPSPSGIGQWSEATFVQVMRTGRGGTLHPAMPWAAYRNMTEDDLRAIYRALQLAPPVRHWVLDSAPPSYCEACGQTHGLGELNESPVLEAADVDPGPIDDYVGVYRLDMATLEVTAADGTLQLSEGGGYGVDLVPVEGGRFMGIGFPSPLSFERDAAGRVTALITWEIGPYRWARVR